MKKFNSNNSTNLTHFFVFVLFTFSSIFVSCSKSEDEEGITNNETCKLTQITHPFFGTYSLTYNDKGYISKSTNTYTLDNGDYRIEAIYFYDGIAKDTGKLSKVTSTIIWNGNKADEKVDEFIYEKGLLKTVSSTHGDRTFEYNAKGLLISSSYFSLVSEYEYNSSDKLISLTQKDENQNILSKIEYEYSTIKRGFALLKGFTLNIFEDFSPMQEFETSRSSGFYINTATNEKIEFNDIINIVSNKKGFATQAKYPDNSILTYGYLGCD
jgi:hypothetical protein